MASMKKPGKPFVYGILLMSYILSTSATTAPDHVDCETGLTFSSISSYNIAVSWNTSCFDDDSRYIIMLEGDTACSKNVECLTNPCTIELLSDMGCYPPAMGPCSSVAFNVTGSTSGILMSNTTVAAPQVPSNDWNLETNIDPENSTLLFAKWNTSLDNNSPAVACATSAMVATYCPDQNEINTMDILEDLKLPAEGNATLSIGACSGGDITLTVTYMSDGVPTETTRSTTYTYEPEVPVSTASPDITTTEISGGDKKSGPTDGEIAGIVIGSIAGVALICGVIFCYIKKMHCFQK